MYFDLNPVISGYFSYLFIDLAALGMTFFILAKLRNIMGGTKQRMAFIGILFSFVVFVLVDMVWCLGYYRWFNVSQILLADIESWTFMSAVVLAYFWSLYVEARCDIGWSHPTLAGVLEITPGLVLLFLTLVSPMAGSLYTLTPNGQVIHGPYYWISVTVGIFYIIYASILAILGALKNRGRVRWIEYMMLQLSAFPLVAALAIDSFIKGTPIFAIGSVCSIFFVFINEMQSQVNQDALTGLNNRRRAMEYLEGNVSRISEDNPMIIFMIDGDFFKDINDQYGHSEGDRALRIIAETLRQTVMSSQVLTARLGGDEFLIAGLRSNVKDPETRVMELRQTLEKLRKEAGVPYPLSVSIGYAQIQDANLPIASMIHEADRALYMDKIRTHGTALTRTRKDAK